MNTEVVVLNCQKCNQSLKSHKLFVLNVFVIVFLLVRSCLLITLSTFLQDCLACRQTNGQCNLQSSLGTAEKQFSVCRPWTEFSLTKDSSQRSRYAQFMTKFKNDEMWSKSYQHSDPTNVMSVLIGEVKVLKALLATTHLPR